MDLVLQNGFYLSRRLIEISNEPQVVQRTAQWFRAREKLITGSIVDSILGTNPYQSVHEVVVNKSVGRSAGSFRGNAFTRHGTKYESRALELYLQTHYPKSKILSYGVVKHDDVGFLAHSPDGILVHPTSEEAPKLLEVKCPATRQPPASGVLAIPPQYYHQIQLGLEVFKLESADYVEYFCETESRPESIYVTTLYKDPDWLLNNLQAFQRFWKAVDTYKEQVIPCLLPPLEIEN